MRTVVLEPTNLSRPLVGAPLKRMTNSCESISAPLSSSSSTPLLPTTAQLSYSLLTPWRSSRTGSAAGSHLSASFSLTFPMRFQAGSFPGKCTLMVPLRLGLSRASTTGPANDCGSSRLTSFFTWSLCSKGVVWESGHAQLPALAWPAGHTGPGDSEGHTHPRPVSLPASWQAPPPAACGRTPAALTGRARNVSDAGSAQRGVSRSPRSGDPSLGVSGYATGCMRGRSPSGCRCGMCCCCRRGAARRGGSCACCCRSGRGGRDPTGPPPLTAAQACISRLHASTTASAQLPVSRQPLSARWHSVSRRVQSATVWSSCCCAALCAAITGSCCLGAGSRALPRSACWPPHGFGAKITTTTSATSASTCSACSCPAPRSPLLPLLSASSAISSASAAASSRAAASSELGGAPAPAAWRCLLENIVGSAGCLRLCPMYPC
mmetsp:Transcript_22237/g.57946  ORF Transcript_22237/g.57946 Transcript_22237/m.57946 type:complete len:436 (-) Transcript_22237:58-1365(-)